MIGHAFHSWLNAIFCNCSSMIKRFFFVSFDDTIETILDDPDLCGTQGSQEPIHLAHMVVGCGG